MQITTTFRGKALIFSGILVIVSCVQDFQVQNFLTSIESKAFIKAAESFGFAHQGSLGPTKGEAYRDNDRMSVNDPVLADTIWVSGLNQLFSDIKIRGKVAVGLNPNIRFYRLVEVSLFAKSSMAVKLYITLARFCFNNFG